MKKQGEIKDKPPNRKFFKIEPRKLEEYLELRPDAYLVEIAEYFSCSEAAIRKALKRLKITGKKDETAKRIITRKGKKLSRSNIRNS